MELWLATGAGSSILDEYWYQDPIPLPALSSSNNSILVDACANLQNLSVSLTVTQDLVTVGDTGFSLQLNAYPQTTSSIQGQTLNWLQYIIYVGGPINNNLGWEIQYWSVGAQPYGPNQPWPPGYTPNPPNSTPWLPALPNDFQVQSFGDANANRIPAGSVMTIQLATNSAGAVTGATFSVTDPQGKVSTAPFTFPTNAVFPIYGFQVDLVGPGGGASCNLISGAGTLQYSVSSGTLTVQTTNTCGGPQPGTAETSNAAYGAVAPPSGSSVSQGLSIVWEGISAVPGSAITGYWDSGNSQHVNYLTADGHVHELYISPGADWTDNDLTALSKGVPAATTSALGAYTGGDGSQHVNFIDLNGHLHELNIQPGAAWIDNDLTALANATPAAPGSAIDGYWGSDGSQHVNFIDLNGHVHEAYIHPGAGWIDTDLTAATNGPVAASGSALSGYWGSDNSQHVNFIGVDGHVHELYIPAGGGWTCNDLTAAANGTPAAPGSAIESYWGGDSSQHVHFIDAGGHVHELYIAPGAAWIDVDLTAATNGPVAAAGNPLSGYWGGDSSQHVNFISVDGHVRELYIAPGAGWTCNDLTAAANGTPAASPRSDSNSRSHTTARGSSLHGYWGADGSQHVNFIGADGHVHELYVHPGAAWVDNDLSART
jgi:hypothetical protein